MCHIPLLKLASNSRAVMPKDCYFVNSFFGARNSALGSHTPGNSGISLMSALQTSRDMVTGLMGTYSRGWLYYIAGVIYSVVHNFARTCDMNQYIMNNLRSTDAVKCSKSVILPNNCANIVKNKRFNHNQINTNMRAYKVEYNAYIFTKNQYCVSQTLVRVW